MTDIPPMTAVAIAAVAGIVTLAAVGIAAIIRDRQSWSEPVNRLGRRLTAHREANADAYTGLRNYYLQLHDHVGHLAADQERLRADLERLLAETAHRRPPSIADPTVRLREATGINLADVGRTARTARLDPTWPTENGARS